MSCHKVKFYNPEFARQHVKRMSAGDTDKQLETFVYKCSICHCWHLTSLPKDHPVLVENTGLKARIRNLEERLESFQFFELEGISSNTSIADKISSYRKKIKDLEHRLKSAEEIRDKLISQNNR